MPCKVQSYRHLKETEQWCVWERGIEITILRKDMRQDILPVGPIKRKLPRVLSGAERFVRANRTQSLTADRAASCPTTLCRSWSSSLRSLRDSLPVIRDTGIPVWRATTVAMASAETKSDSILCWFPPSVGEACSFLSQASNSSSNLGMDACCSSAAFARSPAMWSISD